MKSTILKNFLSIATLTPKQIAIYYKNTKITYAELLIQVKQYGQYFSNLEQKGPIAIHMDRTPKLIAAMLGCWYANRAFIALDCKHPIERKKYVLGNNITDSHIQEITVIDSELDEDIAYILYTSGSTGQPKGIDITHEGVTALVNWAQVYYRKEQLQCILASTTITFDLAVFEIFVPLTCGCSIYLVDSILDLLNKDQDYSKITLINTVPAAMREIVRAKVIPFNVSTINIAGEALTWDLVEDLYQINHIQEVYNLWGPSEDTTYSTVYQCPRYPDTKLRKIPIVPIGQSIKGTKVHIIDQEICLSGISLARGYHNNSELTEKKFITYQGNRLYRTGDIGVIDDEGNIHFKGRIDLQVKVRGFRIELEEIESHLININNVIAAGATAITDNNQTRLIVGVQVGRINSQVSIEYLKNKLAGNIPDYMMPHLWWVTDQPLPRTPNGKLCRKSLGKIILENNKIKSQTTEIKLFYDLVSSILVKDVNHNLSFTANGGDSLNAVRLLTECNQRWQHSLNLLMILDNNKTLAELNNQVFINNTNKIVIKNYPQLKEQILPSERRMWEVYNSSATPSAYNVAIQFELTGEIDIAKLTYSIEQIINQNDVFQYNYIQYDNQLTKIVTNTKLNIL
ncbi:AMP-binding protein [Rickettsia tamurae]|nr:AMP-binding protein [Rickettsia tamurae]